MKKKIIYAISLFCIALASHSQTTTINSTTVSKPVNPNPCTVYGYVDNDLDGYGAGNLVCLDNIFPEDTPTSLIGGDCDDNNPLVTIAQFWYQDSDGDGYGSTSTATKLCYAPLGYIAIGGDCNDNNPSINPTTNWYWDFDNDGFGNPITAPVVACSVSFSFANLTLNNLDCNDNNNLINPNTKWYRDADGDGFGNINVYLTQCLQPPGYILNNMDCDDSNFLLNLIKPWYQDIDNDGFGNPTVSISSCSQPSGYVDNNLDSCPTIAGSIQGCVVPNPAINYDTRNYIITTIPKIAVGNIQSISDPKDVVVNITYYDDLGKANQQISSRQSSSGNNIITHIEYDSYGRQIRNYLPYTTNVQGIDFESGAMFNTLGYNDYIGQNPYTEKLFEASPLNRTLKQAAPGTTNDWAMGGNHEISFDFLTNTSADAVKLYVANATWNATSGLFDISFSQNGSTNYPDNQLFKTVTKDENWVSGVNNTIEEYKDKEGKIILKRNYNNSVSHDTYYVYDQYNNLTFVIPPLVANITTQLDGLCYQYKYDLRNRIVEKKIPGKQWEFIVYDKIDRVVANGPALSPFSDLVAPNNVGWLITKYDVFNRPILTAWQQTAVTSTTRSSLQASYNLASTIVSETKNASAIDSPAILNVACRYSNTVIPTSNYNTLTVNYYDDYNFSFAPTTIPTLVENQTVSYNSTNKPNGLETGTWIRIPELTTTTTIKSERSYCLFDSKSRAVRNYKFNYLGGFTQADSNFKSITGRLEYLIKSHSRSTLTAVVTSKDEFTYSAQDRLLIQTNQVNGGTKQLIASNSYNELGKLISKKVGGTDVTGAIGFQKIDYKYNIRGWLTDINDISSLNQGIDPIDLFAYKINYNNVQNEIGYTGTPLFNGNIAETYWRTNTDNKVRKYGYIYDNLNRLTNAIYQRPGELNPVPNSYNESLNYDKNGNIIRLIRNGNTDYPNILQTIDNLAYTYQANSNLLVKVADNPSTATSGFKDGTNTNDDYGYDVNGNLTLDQNKGITISYNHLNLPHKITFGTSGNITYLYNAVGEKVNKIVTLTSPISINTSDYLDGFQYLNNALQFFPQVEGYITGTYKYVFQYKDHLGNVRLSYTDTDGNLSITNNEIIEENHYYPFGLKHSGYNSSIISSFATLIKNRFNSKEFQDELGLNMTAMDYRQYDPAIARFVVVDPLAEFQRKWSPYSFCYDNPIIYNDPSGLIGESIAKKPKSDEPIILEDVVIENRSKAKPKVNRALSFLWAAVDYVPFAGSIKQIGVGLYEGNTTDVILGVTFLAVDIFTAGEGSEVIKLVEEGVEATAKVAAEDEAKELVEQNLKEVAEDAIHGNSVNSTKATGNYEIKFESGKTYNGVGNAKRMEQSAKNLSNGAAKGDNIVSKTFKGASNRKLAYIREHLHIKANGGAGNVVKNYNQINSPGKKIYEAIKNLK